MSFTVGVLVGLVALIVLLTVSALAGRRRKPPTPHPSTGSRTEECETCGAEISIAVTHLVVEAATDDAHLGNTFGGTAMSAAYCSNHCPGTCTPATRPTHLIH